jgi:hypothetical protein
MESLMRDCLGTDVIAQQLQAIGDADMAAQVALLMMASSAADTEDPDFEEKSERVPRTILQARRQHHQKENQTRSAQRDKVANRVKYLRTKEANRLKLKCGNGRLNAIHSFLPAASKQDAFKTGVLSRAPAYIYSPP